MMNAVSPDGAGKKRAFPVKIYLEKPSFHEVNREIWWTITDKLIKWVQWVLFIALLDILLTVCTYRHSSVCCALSFLSAIRRRRFQCAC